MKEGFKRFCAIVCLAVSVTPCRGQTPALFRVPARETNAEVVLRLSGTNSVNYRVDVATNGFQWEPLVSVRGGTNLQFIDSAAPFLSHRFYRAQEIPTNQVTGDHILTTEGEVVIRPVNHASFVMSWNGKMIYNDPVGGSARYRDFSRADLILVSHSHGDHFDAATLSAIRQTNGVIIVPPSIHSTLASALRTNAIPLANGQSTNVLGLTVEAVPAYNANHPVGSGNGYVVTIGGKRFYMSGDTGDTPEMRALQNIDVAFLCMNIPFTMNITNAASAVADFKPRILYPYHYRNQNNTFADLEALKRMIGTEHGIEVRTRAWY